MYHEVNCSKELAANSQQVLRSHLSLIPSHFFCSAASAEQNIEDITPAAEKEKDLLQRDPVS